MRRVFLLRFFETSARSGENVEEVFLSLSRDVYALVEAGRLRPEEGWDGVKAGYGGEAGRGDTGGVLLALKAGGEWGGGAGSCC